MSRNGKIESSCYIINFPIWKCLLKWDCAQLKYSLTLHIIICVVTDENYAHFYAIMPN